MQFYGYPAISPSKTIRFLGFAHRFLAAKDLNLLSAVKVKVKVPIVFPSLSADNWSSRWCEQSAIDKWNPLFISILVDNENP